VAVLGGFEGPFSPEIALLLQLVPPSYSIYPRLVPDPIRPEPDEITEDQKRNQQQFDSHYFEVAEPPLRDLASASLLALSAARW
jgi:hypothetical protein